MSRDINVGTHVEMTSHGVLPHSDCAGVPRYLRVKRAEVQHSQPCGIVSDAERYKVAPGRRTDLLPIPNHHNYLFHTSTFDA